MMGDGGGPGNSAVSGNFDDWSSRIGVLRSLYQRIRSVSDASADLMGDGQHGSLRLASTGSVFERETFRVMVVGEFSSGKSTLINAMLGKRLLPMKANPATAFTTLLRWGEDERAELYRSADRRSPATVVSTRKFQEEVSLQLDAEGAPREPSFSLAVVSQPLELLRNAVEIVDSAGVNENPERELVTLGFLEEVDAVIYVTDASRPFTLYETQNYLDHVHRLGHRDVFYVVNRFDLIDEEERDEVRSRCVNTVAQLDGRPGERARDHVYFVSARDALRARVTGDHDAVLRTGIIDLEQSLERFCMQDAARVKFVRLAEFLRHTVVRLRRRLQDESGILAKSNTELREILDRSQTARDQLQHNVERIREIVNSWVDMVEADMRLRFETFLIGLSAEVPNWQAQGLGTMRRIGKVLSGGGRDSIARHIVDSYTSILQRRMQVFCSVDLEQALARHQAELLERLDPLIRAYESGLDEVRGELTGVPTPPQSEYLLRSLALSAGRGGYNRAEYEDFPLVFRPVSIAAMAAGTGGGMALAGATGLVGVGAAVPVLGVALVLGAALAPVLGAISLAASDGKLRSKVADDFAAELKKSAGRCAGEYARSRAADLRVVWNGVSDTLAERLLEMIASVKRSIDESRLDEQQKQATRDELYRYEQELTSVEDEIAEFLRPYVAEPPAAEAPPAPGR